MGIAQTTGEMKLYRNLSKLAILRSAKEIGRAAKTCFFCRKKFTKHYEKT